MTKYVVSYSGGIGSFVAAERLMQTVPKDDITLVFCDTLIEDDDLYRFLYEGAEKLGLDLVELVDGRNPWEVFRDVKLQGDSKIAPCSKFLKRIPMDKYLRTLPEPPVLVLGIDYSEIERLARAQKNNSAYTVIAPLCDKPYLSHAARLEVLKKYKIDPPRLYAMGFPHNNCGGFCVRSGLSQMTLLKKRFPERFEWHKQQQKKLVEDNPGVKALATPFLRKTINGKQEYLTLEEFEKNHFDQDQYDFGGCGCFIDV